jgi:hypothetical protein
MIQAYVDNELSTSDRIILEEHLAGCQTCKEQVSRQRKLSAELFEAFVDLRLKRNLRTPVLENLPVMKSPTADLVDINWRAKHRPSRMKQLGRLAPFAAIAVVALLGFLIRLNWPQPAPEVGYVGVVMQAKGHSTRVPDNGTTWRSAYAQDRIRPGDRFETGKESAVMVGLKGSTVVKMNAESRFKVISERRINVEQGEVWLDVGRDGQLFRVGTPEGNITVFGTAFCVSVSKDATTVAVERGEVLVGTQSDFTNLRRGESVSIKPDRSLTKPRSIDPETQSAWAKDIQPDAGAERAYKALVLSQSAKTELAAQEVFFLDASMGGHKWAIRAINVYWEKDAYTQGHCGYDVYVYNDQMAPLFKDRIPAATLDSKTSNLVEIRVPGEPIQNARWLFVRLVPDLSAGRVEAQGLEVRALASQR